MRTPRKWQSAFVCLLALALLPFAPAPEGSAQAPGYTVTDLGTLGGEVSKAYNLDECGRVVGESTLGGGASHPFLWVDANKNGQADAGEMQDLGTLGGATGLAVAVNQGGAVAGTAQNSSSIRRAFIRASGGTMQDLGTLGGETAQAFDMNASGQVVGVSEDDGGLQDRAFVWQSGAGMQGLTASWGTPIRAFGINNAGQIVGTANRFDNGTHAFVTIGGAAVDIGTLGGSLSFASDINESGEVAGYAYIATTPNNITQSNHAFYWKDANGNGQSDAGEMQDLGTLGAGRQSFANDINDSAVVVGNSETVLNSFATHAFIWTGAGGMKDLNTVVPNTGWTFQEARAVNNRGQIVGIGLNPQGKTHAFLLTPTNVAPSPCDSNQNNVPPTANPGGPYSGQVGVAVQFNGSGSSDTDGAVSSYSWDFGDGAVGTGATPSHAYAAAGAYAVTLTVTDDDGATASATASANISAAAEMQGLQYYPLAHPVRLLDTRPGLAACYTPGAPLAANASRTQQATGACGGLSIPPTARAIVGNAAIVSPASSGHITLYPADVPLPTAANLNYVRGQIVSNAYTVGLSPDGAFKIYTPTSTHFVVDIAGYYAPPGQGGLYYHPLPRPVRLLDTRPGLTACDAPGAPLQANASRQEAARTTCGGLVIPDEARAVVGNSAVVSPPADGHITLYPSGSSLPTVANLNYFAGQIISNAYNVTLGADGAFNIYTPTQTHFVVDVAGYYSASAAPDANGVAGMLFYPLSSPARLLDTRAGTTACYTPGAPLQADGVRTQQARGACAGSTVPAAALAVQGNATAVSPSGPGHIILYPTGAERPVVANLNYLGGQIIPNAFTVTLGADGAFNIYTPTQTHLVIDLAGYFAP
jgi:probable HAF family extracellular repeat protein